MSKGRMVPQKQKLLIIADAAVNTGFASVTHNLVNHLHKQWDIDILAINYYGDPHPIQKISNLWSPTALMHGDVYGLSRITALIDTVKPDVLLMINDPWVAAEYTSKLVDIKTTKKVLYTPIDAKNIKPLFVEHINKAFDYVIGYTQFGINELLESGLSLPNSVIPHGIDKNDYFPINRAEVRAKSNLNEDDYIVQMCDRNQIRKRLDLGLYYFAEWVKQTNKPDNVKFYYHGALKDEG